MSRQTRRWKVKLVEADGWVVWDMPLLVALAGALDDDPLCLEALEIWVEPTTFCKWREP